MPHSKPGPTPVRRYRCPTCKREHQATAEVRHRPFCSPRCQLLDLGRWLDEDYRVSDPLGPDALS